VGAECGFGISLASDVLYTCVKIYKIIMLLILLIIIMTTRLMIMIITIMIE